MNVMNNHSSTNIAPVTDAVNSCPSSLDIEDTHLAVRPTNPPSVVLSMTFEEVSRLMASQAPRPAPVFDNEIFDFENDCDDDDGYWSRVTAVKTTVTVNEVAVIPSTPVIFRAEVGYEIPNSDPKAKELSHTVHGGSFSPSCPSSCVPASGYEATSWGFAKVSPALEVSLETSRESIGVLSEILGPGEYKALRSSVCPDPPEAKGGRAGLKIMALVPDLELTPNDVIIDLGCAPGSLTLELAQKFPSASVIGVTNHKPYEGARSLIKPLRTAENFLAVHADIADRIHAELLIDKCSATSNPQPPILESLIHPVANKTVGGRALYSRFHKGIGVSPKLIISDCCVDQEKDAVTTSRRWEWVNNRLVLSAWYIADQISDPDTVVILKLLGAKGHVVQSILHYASCSYREVKLCKPVFSRASNDELYLVCSGRRNDSGLETMRIVFRHACQRALQYNTSVVAGSVYRADWSWASFYEAPRFDAEWCNRLSAILEAFVVRQTLSIHKVLSAAKARDSCPRGRTPLVLKPPVRHPGKLLSAILPRDGKITRGGKLCTPPVNVWTKRVQDIRHVWDRAAVDREVNRQFHIWASSRGVCDKDRNKGDPPTECDCQGDLAEQREEASARNRAMFPAGRVDGLVYCPSGILDSIQFVMGDKAFREAFGEISAERVPIKRRPSHKRASGKGSSSHPRPVAKK